MKPNTEHLGSSGLMIRARPVWNQRPKVYSFHQHRRISKNLRLKHRTNNVKKAWHIVDTLPEVSIPGMSRILDNQYGLAGKILWSIALLGCIVACCSQVYLRVESFLSYPIAVDVAVDQQAKITFPAVTICPFEAFTFNKNINSLRLKYAEENNITYIHNIQDDIPVWEMKHNIDFFDLLDMEDVNVTQLWKLAHFGIDSIHGDIVLCQFHSKRNCHLTLIKENTATFFGTCTTFRLSDDIVFDGHHNGMETMIEGNANEEYWQFMIVLHESEESPNHNVYFDSGHVIHPGFETLLTFTIKQFERSNLPNRPCSEPAESRKCKTTCLENAILANSTCSLPFLPSTHLKLCMTPKEAKETYNRTLEVYKNANELCSHCNRKCKEKYFSMTQDVVKPAWKDDHTHFKVILQDNIVEVVTEQQAHTFGVLISEIGGSLGLFLGMCILTGLQVVEYLVFKIIRKMQHLKK